MQKDIRDIEKVILYGPNGTRIEQTLMLTGTVNNPEYKIIKCTLITRNIHRSRKFCTSHTKSTNGCRHPKIGIDCIGVTCGHFAPKSIINI